MDARYLRDGTPPLPAARHAFHLGAHVANGLGLTTITDHPYHALGTAFAITALVGLWHTNRPGQHSRVDFNVTYPEVYVAPPEPKFKPHANTLLYGISVDPDACTNQNFFGDIIARNDMAVNAEIARAESVFGKSSSIFFHSVVPFLLEHLLALLSVLFSVLFFSLFFVLVSSKLNKLERRLNRKVHDFALTLNRGVRLSSQDYEAILTRIAELEQQVGNEQEAWRIINQLIQRHETFVNAHGDFLTRLNAGGLDIAALAKIKSADVDAQSALLNQLGALDLAALAKFNPAVVDAQSTLLKQLSALDLAALAKFNLTDVEAQSALLTQLSAIDLPALAKVNLVVDGHSALLKQLSALDLAALAKVNLTDVEAQSSLLKQLSAIDIVALAKLSRADAVIDSAVAQLKTLDLPALSKLTSADVAVLEQLATLNIPALAKLGLADAEIHSALEKLKTLNIPALSKLTIAGVDALEQLPAHDIPALSKLTEANVAALEQLAALDVPALAKLNVADVDVLKQRLDAVVSDVHRLSTGTELPADFSSRMDDLTTALSDIKALKTDTDSLKTESARFKVIRQQIVDFVLMSVPTYFKSNKAAREKFPKALAIHLFPNDVEAQLEAQLNAQSKKRDTTDSNRNDNSFGALMATLEVLLDLSARNPGPQEVVPGSTSGLAPRFSASPRPTGYPQTSTVPYQPPSYGLTTPYQPPSYGLTTPYQPPNYGLTTPYQPPNYGPNSVTPSSYIPSNYRPATPYTPAVVMVNNFRDETDTSPETPGASQ